MLDNSSLCYFHVINNSKINEGLAASVVTALLYTGACKIIFKVWTIRAVSTVNFYKSLLIREVTSLMTRQRI